MDDVVAKVLAETWEAESHMNDNGTRSHCLFVPGETEVFAEMGPSDAARARIAACAPEALKLLLDVEWDQEADCCPWCNTYKPGPHAPGCRWLALMKKTGIR